MNCLLTAAACCSPSCRHYSEGRAFTAGGLLRWLRRVTFEFSRYESARRGQPLPRSSGELVAGLPVRRDVVSICSHAASSPMSFSPTTAMAPLDRARLKAYVRLLPILFFSYVIAYVDRVNVGFAKLEMQTDLAPLGFSEAAFGFGMGVFFVGYLVLEIPGTLIVEKWSAKKWISRIMISWGIVAAMTAFVHYRVSGITWLAEFTVRGVAVLFESLAHSRWSWLSRQSQSIADSLNGPGSPYVLQFFAVRFLLGLAEAGFYPGVIVYLTHWFPRRDRTKTLAWFFIGTPVAAIIGPPISERIMSIGERGNPAFLGMVGWQWVFIFWGIPAVILGVLILAILADRPRHARWLTDEERDALETKLAQEKQHQKQHTQHLTIAQALANPRVLALAAAYFFVVTGSYGVELYMASIVRDWYGLEIKKVAYLIIIPAIGALFGQCLIGWNSDRTDVSLAMVPASQETLWLTIALFTLAMIGMKAYLPAFWALPSLFLTESAAAASIGLINSCGNLGGWVGPSVVGFVKQITGEYRYGLWYLAASVIVSAIIIVSVGIGSRPRRLAMPKGAPVSNADLDRASITGPA
jgi:MFS transporter, ACS family, tartrate transporter